MRTEVDAIQKQYERDVAVVTARPLLIQVAFVLWGVVDVLLIGFFVVQVFGYLIAGSFAEARTIATLGNNAASLHATTAQHAAKPLRVGSPTAFPRGDVVDLAARIDNDNADWYATYTSAFTDGGSVTTREESGFILPGESKLILALGVESVSRPANPSVRLTHLAWHRVPYKTVPDVATFLSEHNAFTVVSATYAADITIQGKTIARSIFTVKNNTPYSYWSPSYVVTLTRNGAVIGVHEVTVSSFRAGETRTFEARWFDNVPLSATVTLTPSINYFDAGVYKPPEGEQAVDLRDVFERQR